MARQLHGVFIGIDRFASPAINWLSCAERDATALHSLFADNLGGSNALLLGKDATRANIQKEFERLAACDKDDIVVVTFSGHGTDTHELVTYDADPTNLPATCIPLDELSGWLAKIPARQVICVLDCCFSGGMGAKALQVDTVSRSAQSADDLLKQLSGDGRVILTASLANEKAWESGRLGHGLLTYYLLEALQGAEEVKKAGKISFYKLLEYVTEKVKDGATALGKPQHPLLLGKIEGELTLPIFKPGALYAAAFPDRVRQKVTADIESLASYGFPDELLKAWAGLIPSLNQLQIDAINEFGLLDGEHVVVSAPTSSGKTMIGELGALRGVIDHKRAFFLFPLKALVNDKQRHFEETYGAFGLRTIKATGESTSDDILPLMRGQYDVCLMTYEKFSALVLTNPYILDQVGTIVIDEAQMVADKNRGVNLEFILTLLRMRRKQGAEPQLIALSAVIGEMNGFDRWLGARLLSRTERPVPLDEGIIRWDGSVRYIESDTGEEKNIARVVNPVPGKTSSQAVIIPLTAKLVSEDKSVIVFRETKGEAQGCALYLAKNLGLPPAQVALDTLPNTDPSISSQKLREALEGGVAFHIADLDAEERRVVEEQFRATPTALKVIASTTTLAMGVNTPAEAVIIAGLDHPGNQPYSIAEYKNIVGRAGRLGYATRGASYVVVMNANEEQAVWNKYVLGAPEDLESKFITATSDVRSLIVRVLVSVRSKRGLTQQEIVDFLEESFGAFQNKLSNPAWAWDEFGIVAALDDLQEHQLLEQDKDGFFHPTQIGRLAGEAGVEVESVVRVVAALSGLSPAEITDPALIAVAQVTVELDQVYFPINKSSTQKEPQAWMGELRNQNIPAQIVNAMGRNVSEDVETTLRAKRTAASLLWITDQQMADIESAMMQFHRSDNAAGAIRGVSSRACDVLPVVAKIAELVCPGLDLENRMGRLIARLELGLPASMVELGKVVGKTFTRGDYLALLKAGITTVEQFESAKESVLLGCLGNDSQKLESAKRIILANSKETKSLPILPILPPYEG